MPMRLETACAYKRTGIPGACCSVRQPQQPRQPRQPQQPRQPRQHRRAGAHTLPSASSSGLGTISSLQPRVRMAASRTPASPSAACRRRARVWALGLGLRVYSQNSLRPSGKHGGLATSLLSQQRVKSPRAPVEMQRGDWGPSRRPPVRRGERGRWGGRAAGGRAPAQQERRACCLPRSLMAPASTGWDHALRSSCTAWAPAHTMHRCCALLSDTLCLRRGLSDCAWAQCIKVGAQRPLTPQHATAAHTATGHDCDLTTQRC